MTDLTQPFDAMQVEQRLKEQASKIEELEKNCKRDQSERASLALKLRIGEAKIKKKCQTFEASVNSMSVRIKVLEREAVVVDERQKTCRKDRRNNRAEFRHINCSLRKLKRKIKAARTVKSLESSNGQVGPEVAASGKGKAKQISRIIKEQGKQYRMINQVRTLKFVQFRQSVY
ncbi:hypothetical protein VMCG_06616 [Cytospora schulzeri]|uniref:Uncharacterized protein n=1 Tax=Cytospora schulzeri TaxID=448051 RepID=A0A423W6S8_9PEZI|nr:hypothetical protein VMCG_06616 [Valsa malicola]